MKNKSITLILILSMLFNFSLLAQWESIGSGISVGQRDIFSISVVDENNIWAIPKKPTSAVLYEYTRTTDGGITWQEGSLPDTIGNYYPVNIFALDENTAWIIMVNLPQKSHIKIFKTGDGGISWEEQDGEFNEVGHTFATLHFFNEHEGIGFGSPGSGNQSIDSLQIFRTNNGGENWNRIPPSDLPSPLSGEGVWVYSGNNSYDVKGDTVWFVTRASRVFRSIDKGATWEAFDVGISGTSGSGLASIAFENSLNGIAVTFQPSKAAKTIDGGETWMEITIPTTARLGAIEYIPGTENTYLTNDGFQESSNMLLTTDGGTTWEIVSYSPSMDCMQFISPTIGFGGGAINPANDVGLYKWIGNLSDSTTTNIKSVFLNTNKLTLSPNPVSNQLQVSIENEWQGTLHLQVVNALGQTIQSTFIEKNETEFSQQINVAGLPIGVYRLLVSDGEEMMIQAFVKN